MTKKLIFLIVSINLFAVQPVTDTMSYTYLINSINQTTQLINGMRTQIETLGGIRTVMDEVKGDINDARSTLEGSLESLEQSGESLKKATSNIEVKSLFDINADKTTQTGSGIAYEDIKKVFTDTFKKADEALIKSLGGEQSFIKSKKNRYKLIKALKTNSIKDFKKVMNSRISDSEIKQLKKEIFVQDFIKDTKRLTVDSKIGISSKIISQEWTKEFFPTKREDLQEKEQRRERLAQLQKFIQSSKDLRQNIKTTNMILMEMLTLQQKQYNMALNFRNAIVSHFIRNNHNNKLIEELKKRQDEMNRSVNPIPKEIRNNRVNNNMKGANPYAIGWRPVPKEIRRP